MIKFKLLHDKAKAPTRATEGAAGFDLYCCEHATLYPGVHAVLGTGVAMAIPPRHVGLIWPRSGMAARHGVDTLAGVVDSDYRGEVRVSLINHGDRPVELKPGDRIAQIIFQQHLSWADVVDELDETERGDGGFGSTGY